MIKGIFLNRIEQPNPAPHVPPAHSSRKHSLTITIPAYNEEEAIESIIRRCLDARKEIARKANLDDVKIIVVDDGSHDRTYERASAFLPDITLLKHEQNKGYGAAIKNGFRHSDTSLVGFLDADGTCNPLFFSELCNVLQANSYDMTLGSRMGPQSEMPMVRRIGNTIYSVLLSLLTHKKIRDTASGMRVMKADLLKKIYPLPDGLHFTPAMTSRILFKAGLSLGEVPMPYADRIGKSKLNVIKDGIRFLRVILEMALIYRPLLFFGVAAGILFSICFYYGPGLVMDAVRLKTIPNDRIYRVLALMTSCVGGLMMLGVGFLAQKTACLLHGDHDPYEQYYKPILGWIAPFGAISIVAGVAINLAPLSEYLARGEILHSWVYIAAGAFSVLVGLQLLSIAVLNTVLDLVVHHHQEQE